MLKIQWLQPGIDLVNGAMQQTYPQCWEAALALFGDRMPAPIREALPTLNVRITKLMETIAEGDMTIAHGDYRLDNLFFGGEGSGYELAVLDFDACAFEDRLCAIGNRQVTDAQFSLRRSWCRAARTRSRRT